MRGSEALERPLTRPIVTVGNFDGVHVGHRAIMHTVVRRARDRDGEAVVYTFDPHPRKVISPERAPSLLTTVEQRLELLEECGVDVVVVEPFTLEFSRTPPEIFIRERLHERLRPVEVYVGYDFHFGRDREGSMRMLAEMGPRLGFSVTIIPEVTVDQGDVNSSRIRELLGESRLGEARRMLGRPYTVRGPVVEGDRRGQEIGFPTANVAPENEVLPASGVYAGHVLLLDDGGPARGTAHPAVTNVGRRPTFGAGDEITVEAHLIGFEGDLYGRRIDLCFEHHIRAERRFEGLEALKTQIAADVAEGRRRLESS